MSYLSIQMSVAHGVRSILGAIDHVIVIIGPLHGSYDSIDVIYLTEDFLIFFCNNSSKKLNNFQLKI